MIQKWGRDPYGVFGLIVTPTRELALQIKDQILFMGGERAKVCLVIGGVDFQEQAIELFSKPSFVVATPGRLVLFDKSNGVHILKGFLYIIFRLLDHLQSAESTFRNTFKNCKYLVYDEADKLLDGQFDENLTAISSALPKKKQVMLFSATMLSHEKMVPVVKELSQSTEMVSLKRSWPG